MTRTVRIWLVDAFSGEPFGGNPAAVVLDATPLDDELMRRIAAEMNRQATAFVAAPARADADFGLRWFTPSGAELTFCGHGTVAAAHVLSEERRLPGLRVVFGTVRGRLPVTVDSPAPSVIWLEPALPACVPYREPLGPIVEALGLPPEHVATWAAPALTSEADVLIPVTGLDALKALAPDTARLARLGVERRIRGIAVTARETVERESSTHTRFFAPHLGILEDPTTGSLHAALPVWLCEAGLLRAAAGVAAFRAEQGDYLGRPGRLRVELHVPEGTPTRVRVGGQAVTVVTGTLRLPGTQSVVTAS